MICIHLEKATMSAGVVNLADINEKCNSNAYIKIIQDTYDRQLQP